MGAPYGNRNAAGPHKMTGKYAKRPAKYTKGWYKKSMAKRAITLSGFEEWLSRQNKRRWVSRIR